MKTRPGEMASQLPDSGDAAQKLAARGATVEHAAHLYGRDDGSRISQRPIDMFAVRSYSQYSIFDIVDRSNDSAAVAPDAGADVPVRTRIDLLRKVVLRVYESDTPGHDRRSLPAGHGLHRSN